MTITRKVLLTGGTGFIGRHLAAALRAAGHEVTSLQRSPIKIPGTIETICVPEFSPERISQALTGRKFDWLFYLAAYGIDPRDRDIEPMLRVNVGVLSRMVQEAASWPARAVVVVGTGSEYDLTNVSHAVPETHPLEAFKLYGSTKAAGTLCSLAIGRSLNIPLVAARVFGVFGFGEARQRLLPTLVDHLRRKERVSLTSGNHLRDNLYVADAVTALLALASTIEASPQQIVVNVGSGKAPTVRFFVETVAETLGASASLLGFGDIPMRPDDPHCFSGDIRRLNDLVDWKPRHSLADGIRLSVSKYLESIVA